MLNEMGAALASLPPAAEMLVKVTAFLAAAWGVAPLARRCNPRWQVLYWRGIAIGVLILPIAVLIGPSFSISIPLREPETPESVALTLPATDAMAEDSAADGWMRAEVSDETPFASSSSEASQVPAAIPTSTQ